MDEIRANEPEIIDDSFYTWHFKLRPPVLFAEAVPRLPQIANRKICRRIHVVFKMSLMTFGKALSAAFVAMVPLRIKP